jgi:hypothetical protein
LADNTSLAPDTQTITNDYLARIANDGNNEKWDGAIPTGEDKWTGSNPDTPTAGNWKRWIVDGGSDYQVGVPAGSFSINAEVNKVRQAVNARDIKWTAVINYWHAEVGTETIAGKWLNYLFQLTPEATSDLSYAKLQKTLSQAVADSLIETWDIKYSYWSTRPDQEFSNLNKAIKTPNSPGFISDSAAVSATAASILSEIFPAQKELLMQDKQAATNFALYAGIDFDSDIKAGVKLGDSIAAEVLSKVKLTMLETPSTSQIPMNSLNSQFDESKRPNVASGSVISKTSSSELPLVSLTRLKFQDRPFVVTSNLELQTSADWQAESLTTKLPAGDATVNVANKYIVVAKVYPASNLTLVQDTRILVYDLAKQETSLLEADQASAGAELLVKTLQSQNDKLVYYYIPNQARNSLDRSLNTNYKYLVRREIDLAKQEYTDTKINYPKDLFGFGFSNFTISSPARNYLAVFGRKDNLMVSVYLLIKPDGALEQKYRSDQVLTNAANRADQEFLSTIDPSPEQFSLRYSSTNFSTPRKVDLLRDNKLIASIDLAQFEAVTIYAIDSEYLFLNLTSQISDVSSNIIAVAIADGKTYKAIDNKRYELKTPGNSLVTISEKQLQLVGQ